MSSPRLASPRHGTGFVVDSELQPEPAFWKINPGPPPSPTAITLVGVVMIENRSALDSVGTVFRSMPSQRKVTPFAALIQTSFADRPWTLNTVLGTPAGSAASVQL